jgi:hypothetical protein
MNIRTFEYYIIISHSFSLFFILCLLFFLVDDKGRENSEYRYNQIWTIEKLLYNYKNKDGEIQTIIRLKPIELDQIRLV